MIMANVIILIITMTTTSTNSIINITINALLSDIQICHQPCDQFGYREHCCSNMRPTHYAGPDTLTVLPLRQ